MEMKAIPESFKMTELGPLPEEWEVVRFSDCIAKQRIKIPPSILKSEYKPTGKYPIVDQSMNFIAGYTDENEKILRQQLPVIIFGDHTRIFKFVDFPFAIGADGTKIIFPKKDTFDPNFLYYYFLNLKIPSKGYNRHFKLLKESIVVRPSLPEQRAIANVLSTVQEAKEKTDAVITATKELKKSLMKHLFAYGPVSVEEVENVPLKETEIGLVPEGWGVKKIGSFAKFQGGYAFKSTDYQPEGVPVFKISNVSFGETVWNEKSYLPYSYLSEYSQFELKPGDLVMAMTRPIVSGGIKIAGLKDSDCPCLLNQRVGRFIVNQSVDTLFLFQILFDQSFISSISHGALGSQQPNISANKIEQISVPHPPLPIQQKIASILSAVDEKIEKEETKKKALEDLFKTLLNILMTGKLRVNHLEV